MSNSVNACLTMRFQIIERAIDEAEIVVNEMSDIKVKQVGFINYGVKDIDRGYLIAKVAKTFYNEYMYDTFNV